MKTRKRRLPISSHVLAGVFRYSTNTYRSLATGEIMFDVIGSEKYARRLRMWAIALTLAASAMGQTPARSLPFVGCTSYGQAEEIGAPKGVSVKRPLSQHDAGNLAYYKSAEIGLVAPKGWKCEGYSDSSGWGLFLSPEPIEGEPRWPNFKGPAIDLRRISRENGFGHSRIAEAVSRLFPTFRTWAARSMEGFDTPLPCGPYPTDRLRYRSPRVVEFETPPQTKGLQQRLLTIGSERQAHFRRSNFDRQSARTFACVEYPPSE